MANKRHSQLRAVWIEIRAMLADKSDWLVTANRVLCGLKCRIIEYNSKSWYSHKRYRLIEDEAVWLRLLEDRNRTLQNYDEKLADEIAARVTADYAAAVGKLVEKLDELI